MAAPARCLAPRAAHILMLDNAATVVRAELWEFGRLAWFIADLDTTPLSPLRFGLIATALLRVYHDRLPDQASDPEQLVWIFGLGDPIEYLHATFRVFHPKHAAFLRGPLDFCDVSLFSQPSFRPCTRPSWSRLPCSPVLTRSGA